MSVAAGVSPWRCLSGASPVGLRVTEFTWRPEVSEEITEFVIVLVPGCLATESGWRGPSAAACEAAVGEMGASLLAAEVAVRGGKTRSGKCHTPHIQ
jgi:hypothetical protein